MKLNLNKVLLISLSFLSLILLFLFFTFKSGWEIKNKPNKPLHEIKIVAFGDSLIYGTGSSGGGFVKILSDELGINILNMGKPGDSTLSARKRLESVLELNPDLVIIALGGNDFLQRLGPKEKVKERLRQIIGTLQKSGSAIVLLEEPGYKSIYKYLAKSTGSYYVPNILDGLMGNTELMYDRIHPNDKGYTKIAKKVKQAILDLLNN